MKHPCQAIIIRLAPDPSSGEVLNIGVALHSAEHRFFGARFTSTWKRVTEAFPDADRVHLQRVARAITTACDAIYEAQLSFAPPSDVTEAMRRIVPDDDASLLLSHPLSGVTNDPERTLRELFERYVVHGEPSKKRPSRSDGDVWRSVAGALRERGVLGRLQARVLRGKHDYEERFENGWKNSHWHVARPISLDLLDGSDIRHKAAEWTGRIRSVEPDKQQTTVVLFVGLPAVTTAEALQQAARQGLGLLRDQLADEHIAEVLVETDAPRLAERIASDIAQHDADAEE